MIKSREEILSLIKDRIGDDTSDDAIQIIEDVTDTLNDYETRVADSGDWKARYEQNDAEWRKRYRDRFFDGEVKDKKETEEETEEVQKTYTYDELFKED